MLTFIFLNENAGFRKKVGQNENLGPSSIAAFGKSADVPYFRLP
jgi:hypothetical protein